MKSKKLTKREFERAIKLGLGRAVLHVRDYGDAGVEEILERAMFESNIFDSMFEGCRAWWLFSILSNSGNLSRYAEVFDRSWDSASRKSLDRAHQVRLAGYFFENGFFSLRQSILSNAVRLIRIKKHLVIAAEELMDVFNEEGFELALTEMAKVELRVSEDDYDCNAIQKHAEENFGESRVEEILDKCETTNSAVKSFRECVASFNEEDVDAPQKRTFTLSEILNLDLVIQSHTHIPAHSQFGRKASDEEIRAVFDALRNTDNSLKQHAYLQVFSDRDLPHLDSKIISLVDSDQKEVRRACIKALSRFSDESVRQLSLNLISSSEDERIEFGLDLLVQNYDPSDAPMVLTALKRIKDKDHLHWAGMHVDDIADKGRREELSDSFLWLFNNGPDSFCRRRFIKKLIEWNTCPPDVIFEAQWDVSDDVQALARNYFAMERLKQNQKNSSISE